MPTILTYGDSNTHGTNPMPTRDANIRFEPGVRWPTVMLAALGADWRLSEEGLPGRTTQLDDPVMGAHMNGLIGLRIALASHQPLDMLTIMLGTNDLKTRFNASVEHITAGVAGLLDVALNADIQARHGPFKILLIAPPPVIEAGVLAGEFWGGEAIAPTLAPAYQALATSRRVGFIDAGAHIAVSPIDGVHFDAAAHQVLGQAVAEAVANL